MALARLSLHESHFQFLLVASMLPLYGFLCAGRFNFRLLPSDGPLPPANSCPSKNMQTNKRLDHQALSKSPTGEKKRRLPPAQKKYRHRCSINKGTLATLGILLIK